MPSAATSIAMTKIALVLECLAACLLVAAACGASPLLPWSLYDEGGVQLELGLLKGNDDGLLQAGASQGFWYSDDDVCRSVITIRGGESCRFCTTAGRSALAFIIVASGSAMLAAYVTSVRLAVSRYRRTSAALNLTSAGATLIAWTVWTTCHDRVRDDLDELADPNISGDNLKLYVGFWLAALATVLVLPAAVLLFLSGSFKPERAGRGRNAEAADPETGGGAAEMARSSSAATGVQSPDDGGGDKSSRSNSRSSSDNNEEEE